MGDRVRERRKASKGDVAAVWQNPKRQWGSTRECKHRDRFRGVSAEAAPRHERTARRNRAAPPPSLSRAHPLRPSPAPHRHHRPTRRRHKRGVTHFSARHAHQPHPLNPEETQATRSQSLTRSPATFRSMCFADSSRRLYSTLRATAQQCGDGARKMWSESEAAREMRGKGDRASGQGRSARRQGRSRARRPREIGRGEQREMWTTRSVSGFGGVSGC